MIAEPRSRGGTSVRPAIVVAEDDELLRRYFVTVLELEGYEVLPACDGLDALELLQTRRDACVLVTDIDMPRMDGFALAERIRDCRREVDVVYVSGRDHDDIARRGVPGSMFLPKPWTPDALRDAMFARPGDVELVA